MYVDRLKTRIPPERRKDWPDLRPPATEVTVVSDDEGGDREHSGGDRVGDADFDEISRPRDPSRRTPVVSGTAAGAAADDGADRAGRTPELSRNGGGTPTPSGTYVDGTDSNRDADGEVGRGEGYDKKKFEV